MAEFCKVMRQVARMCASHNNDCAGCGLVKECMECPLEGMPENWQVRAGKLASIERIVMDWAEKHPEPRYPTWAEWLRMLGVVMLSDIIPADIAEKLGVKPIGGVNDENA